MDTEACRFPPVSAGLRRSAGGAGRAATFTVFRRASRALPSDVLSDVLSAYTSSAEYTLSNELPAELGQIIDDRT